MSASALIKFRLFNHQQPSSEYISAMSAVHIAVFTPVLVHVTCIIKVHMALVLGGTSLILSLLPKQSLICPQVHTYMEICMHIGQPNRHVTKYNIMSYVSYTIHFSTFVHSFHFVHAYIYIAGSYYYFDHGWAGRASQWTTLKRLHIK